MALAKSQVGSKISDHKKAHGQPPKVAQRDVRVTGSSVRPFIVMVL